MKLSFTQSAWLLVLTRGGLTLAQDASTQDLTVPDEPAVAAPEATTSVIVEEPPTETVDVETELSISESSSASESIEESVSTEVASSTSEETDTAGTPTSDSTGTPTPTEDDDEGDGDELVLVKDPSKLKNSTAKFVPAEITTDIRLAEQEVNKPTTELSDEDAKQIASLEGGLFREFVESAPAPVDADKITIPANTSSCDLSLRKRLWPLHKRAPEKRACTPIREMNFDVYYNFVLPERYGQVPPKLWERVGDSHVLLTNAFAPLGINFAIAGTQNWWPPASGPNSDWSKMIKNEERLLRWQRISHQGDKMTLNVWIVSEVNRRDGGGLLGYATFPKDIASNGKIDGIVMAQDAMGEWVSGSASGSTLVHEVGHWLGLYHTFGRTVKDSADDCAYGDGLLQSTHTRGDEAVVFECSQKPCGSDTAEDIYNWMSYSSCPGGPEANLGFTTDQKAAMFARSIHFRRGIKSGECKPGDPSGRVSRRSTMQDLVDGVCPNIDKAVEEIKKLDKEVTDTSQAPPKADDDDDAATVLTMVSPFAAAFVGVTSLFLLL